MDMNDVMFLLLILWVRCNSVIAHMRYLPIITMGIILPVVISPIMFDLWVKKGSGNANFLFFQGLALWVFLALFVIEFVNTVIRSEQESQVDQKEQNTTSKASGEERK